MYYHCSILDEPQTCTFLEETSAKDAQQKAADRFTIAPEHVVVKEVSYSPYQAIAVLEGLEIAASFGEDTFVVVIPQE